ncbi:MAG: alpha/beta hydrolase [Sulfitobacter sp.]
MLKLEDASTLSVNKTNLAYHEAGEGQLLVLVHGGVADLRTWSHQFPLFSDSYRTIAYSRRYHLPNPPISPDAPDPIQIHIDDLASLIEMRGGGAAHVVGHSWGGLITLMLALQRPDLVRSAVLIEPPVVSIHVNVPPKISQMVRLFLRSPGLAIAIAKLGGGVLAQAEKAFRAADDKKAIALFGRGVLGKRRFEELSSERYQQVWDNRGPDRAQALYKGFPDLIGTRFSEVAVPMLLVAGSESPPVFRLLIDDLSQRLPFATKTVIPGASHMVHEDAPAALNEAVLGHLSAAS